MKRLVIEGLRTICGGPFSFSVEGGECLALSGPSGCGKSLLLRAIADLDPAEGQIHLEGKSRHEIPAPLWRRKVGWLPAESGWWAEEVGEHFYGGPRANANDQKKCHLDEEALPTLGRLGFERDVLAWRVDRLSTGEKQRLALFRLLLNKPKVLLLDEPTAALDHVNIHVVEKVIEETRQTLGTAVLWVSHNSEQIARISDRHFQWSGSGLEEVS